MEDIRVLLQVGDDALPVWGDHLVLFADVVEEAVLVAGGLDAAAHDKASNGEHVQLRHDGEGVALAHQQSVQEPWEKMCNLNNFLPQAFYIKHTLSMDLKLAVSRDFLAFFISWIKPIWAPD